MRQEVPSPSRSTESDRARIVAIVGPTAVGKSAVAVELAERFGGEILNVDSMQVYRGLDIGTAKPGPELRSRVPHHLLDIVDPWEEFNAMRFAQAGERALMDVLGRRRVPILCGGTGLYFRALLEGLFEAASPPREVRERLEQECKEKGPHALLERLRAIDPEWAAGLSSNDWHRIVRALEVFEATGQKPSDLKRNQKPKRWIRQTRFLGLFSDWKEIDRRIEERTDWMFRAGLLQEAKWLLESGGGSRTVRQAIGYREVFSYLRSEISLRQARGEVAAATRRLARRQMTWFRHQHHVRWVDPGDREPLAEEVRKILAFG